MPVANKNQKKIVFVIVEGISDREALALVFGELLADERVIVEFTAGDITTRRGVKPQNIAAEIGNLVSGYAKQFFFGPSDFLEVVHIVDMDGAYIDDIGVIAAATPKAVYCGSCIKIDKPSRIIRRNLQKRKNINRLVGLPKVWGSVKYSIYFVSCNLDHFLYGEANLNPALKTSYATKFAAKYRGKGLEFLRFINEAELQTAATYEDSWNYIKKDNNSLCRCSNLDILFSEQAKVVKRQFKY